MTSMIGRKRSVTLLLSLVLGLVGRECLAAPESASARPLKSFWVPAFEKVLIPDNADAYVGKTIQLKADPSDAVRVNLGYRFIAKNVGPINAVVGGIPYSVEPGSMLTRRKATGGRIAELPADAMILCQEPVQRNLTQALASAATLGLTQIAARYATDVQLCAVDADRDGNIERLFLGGAKQQQDLEFTTIDPVPYDYRENYQVADVRFVLHLVKRMFGGPVLVAGVQRTDGGVTDVSILWFERNGKLVSQPVIIPIKKGDFPHEIKIGSAVLSVKAYDEVSGVADIEFSKFFDLERIDWAIAPQTIYIYY